MLRLVLILALAAALLGAAVFLRRYLPAAAPPAVPDPLAAPRRRLRLMQWTAGALPLAAFFVLANSDATLAAALLGVWLMLAAGLAITDAGLRRVAEGEAWLPQALTGAALVGAGLDAVLLVAAVPWWLAALVAVAGAVGMLFALDHWPWAEARSPDLARGRRRLGALRSAAAAIEAPALRHRAEALATGAATLLDRLNDGPAARRFLSLWLRGARDATQAFVRAEGWADPDATRRFEALLTTLETSLARLRDTMRASDRTRLDVEIEVLTERLQAAGLA